MSEYLKRKQLVSCPGPTGPSGYGPGTTGPTGPFGPSGITGPSGIIGLPGPTSSGVTGPAGFSGLTGLIGATGVIGLSGDPLPPPGITGGITSIYQIMPLVLGFPVSVANTIPGILSYTGSNVVAFPTANGWENVNTIHLAPRTTVVFDSSGFLTFSNTDTNWVSVSVPFGSGNKKNSYRVYFF